MSESNSCFNFADNAKQLYSLVCLNNTSKQTSINHQSMDYVCKSDLNTGLQGRCHNENIMSSNEFHQCYSLAPLTGKT